MWCYAMNYKCYTTHSLYRHTNVDHIFLDWSIPYNIHIVYGVHLVETFYSMPLFRTVIVSILYFHVVIVEWYSLEALHYRRQKQWCLNRLLLNQFYLEKNFSFIFIPKIIFSINSHIWSSCCVFSFDRNWRFFQFVNINKLQLKVVGFNCTVAKKWVD